MPTGYTDCIGKGATFEEFVWRCARAFGACITMRDDGIDIMPPEAFKPDTWHRDGLEKERATLFDLERMSSEEAERRAAVRYEEEVTSRSEAIARDRDLAAKYGAMLERVKCWSAPTPDHESLRAFMIQQVEDSIRFDCDIERCWQEPKRMSGKEWLTGYIERTRDTIAYHETGQREEDDRTAKRNEWLATLRGSVPMPTARGRAVDANK